MHNYEKYDFYREWIGVLKSTIFYNPSIGTFYAGNVFRNLIPSTFLIQNKDDAINESFLRRTFVHTSKNKRDIHKIINFLCSLGLLPIVHTDYDSDVGRYGYKEDKIYSDPRNVFVVSTCRDIRQHVVKSNMYDILLENQECFISKSKEYMGSDKPVRIVEYDTNNKPLRHKIYDAVLYAENWSLLTTQEKILRCCFTILFTPTVVVPAILLLSYLGNRVLREEAHRLNLLSWHYREYNVGVRTAYEDILNDDIPSIKREKILSHIKREAEKQNFMENDKAGQLQLTELGKNVSIKDNLLLIAGKNELTKKQLLLRCATFLVLTSILLLKLIALSCHFFKIDKIALYCSIASYAVMLMGGLYLLSYKNRISRVCAAFLIGFACIFAAANVLMLYYNPQFGHELILSGIIAGITGIMIAVALICHYKYRDDRNVTSKLEGLSTTAYLAIKDQVEVLDGVEYIKLGKHDFTVTEDFSLPLYNAYQANVFGDALSEMQQSQEDSINPAENSGEGQGHSSSSPNQGPDLSIGALNPSEPTDKETRDGVISDLSIKGMTEDTTRKVH
ncbi:hypothetical protein EDL79_04760 [Ehrlichia ruminantium]|uniref:Uncharacterized protein n=1 Tax=Ehrlichia ruminantium TaxID=779 RepID=A0AAE6Q9I8_EHRRU|nr:hypothetical protein [Ehrlichia ruminantium]QGR03834.1 hypothetical protein EDL80_04750 [Ehrlichia ruminantium]QGR04761.1 hypothetical protein EDL79_04760 [Ehrlichia ruminantium]